MNTWYDQPMSTIPCSKHPTAGFIYSSLAAVRYFKGSRQVLDDLVDDKVVTATTQRKYRGTDRTGPVRESVCVECCKERV